MARYPLLEAMRAKAQLDHDEIAAPHKAAASRAMADARGEREARLGLERVMRSKVAPYVVETLGREVGTALEREIMKAAVGAMKAGPETTITVPTGMLMHADPHSIVSRVIDWWKRENAPRIDFRAYRGGIEQKQSITTVEVRVPEMRYRHKIADSI